MISAELSLVESTLRQLTNPNNEERRKAEIQLDQLMQNKVGLIYCLSQVLTSSTEEPVLIYAAVVFRKLVQLDTKDVVSPVWTSATPEIKSEIKINVLRAITSTTSKQLKKKYADIIANLCESIYGSDDKWTEALKYIVDGFLMPLNAENMTTVENATYLFSKVFSFAHREFLEGVDVLWNGFIKFFKEGTLDLQSCSVEAICEILSSYADKKWIKKFRDFTFNILQTTLNCLKENQIDNLKKCILALSDWAQTQPIMLKKSFGDIFILMGKIIEKKDIDEEVLRSLSFEVLWTLIEKYPAVIKDDTERLTLWINSIFKYGMEFDDEIDDDWLTPKSKNLVDETYIPEEKLEEALSLIDRLILNTDKDRKVTLGMVSTTVMELLNHANEHWKFKYIAYMSIGSISDNVSDIKSIEKIIDIIHADINNENPKIRYACLYCINQFTTKFMEDYTTQYHGSSIAQILNLLQNDSVLRVKLQVCDSIDEIVSNIEISILTPYIPQMLDSIFSQFLKPDEQCPQSLRMELLDTLNEIIDKIKDDFKTYAEKCFCVVYDYFKSAAQNNKNIDLSLIGSLLQTITHIGEYCEGILNQNALEIGTALIYYQNNISNFKSDFGTLFKSSWEVILPTIKSSHKDIIPKIIESAINVITKPPEVAVSSKPEEKIDIQKFVNEVTSEKQKITLEKEKISSLITSETDEYVIFLDLFNLFLIEWKDYITPYLEIAEIAMKKVVTYPNADIRCEAARSFPLLLSAASGKLDLEKIKLLIKSYLTIIFEWLDKEKENVVISELLSTVSDLLRDQEKILTQEEIQQVFSKWFTVFDKVEMSRLCLLAAETNAMKEVDETKKVTKAEDESDDDGEENLENIRDEIKEIEDVLISYSDSIGALFKSHKELSWDVAKKMLTDVLPKYFLDKSSNFEKKMGLFILDDMVEYLGQEWLSQIWNDIAKILLSYLDSPYCELRQAANYGLGEFIKHTKQNYLQYAEEIRAGLYKALDVNADGQNDEEYNQAQDNVVTALGKLVKFQGVNYSNLGEIVQKWFNYLPLKHDVSEAPGMHDLLCDIILNQPVLVFGANNESVAKVIKVLCHIYENKKLSNKDVDAKIVKILGEIKNNANFAQFIEEAKNNCSKKIAIKIKNIFG